MAAKKPDSVSEGRKASAKPMTERIVVRTVSASAGSNPNRLLREAAWIRMFGRVESKNPFTR